MAIYTLPTPDTARPFWRDLPADEVVASVYLDVAAVQCLKYAPLSDAEVGVPVNYFLAIITQARNIFNAGKAPSGGDFDGSGYGIVSFPLDWQVKNMLRPERGIGALV